MGKIIYDATLLKYISLFETLTGAKVKDCFIDEKVTFIVEKGNMGLAIGRKGSNMHRVEDTIKKPIRIIEFDDDVCQFIKNYAYPMRDLEVEQEGKNITIRGKDTKTRAILIGRDKSNLKKMISVTQRFFDVENIAVV